MFSRRSNKNTTEENSSNGIESMEIESENSETSSGSSNLRTGYCPQVSYLSFSFYFTR